jgi:CheY-like chemotaxis protein
VEDQALIALSEKETLESHGFSVTAVYRGEDAVQQVESDPAIDLVLMDIDLGDGIDGTEAAQQILEIRELPIVFLTSHREKEYVERMKQITSYGYVLKNAGQFVLIQSIETAFNLFEAHARRAEIGIVYRLDPDYRKQKDGVFTRPTWTAAEQEDAQIDNCVYSPDSDILDHAMIHVQYENGVKASLFWNIFGPAAEDEETIELVGSSGRMRLIRDTGEIDIISNYGATHRSVDARGEHFESSHFGADIELLYAIRRHYEGHDPVAGTHDGYESLRMVLNTQEAIEAGGRVHSLTR